MSGFLSLRDLNGNGNEERPKPPSVKLAERWYERDQKRSSYMFVSSKAVDSEQDALNKKIAERQADVQFLMQKSTYYARNSVSFAMDDLNSQKSSILRSSPTKSPTKGPSSPLRSPNNSTFNMSKSVQPSSF